MPGSGSGLTPSWSARVSVLVRLPHPSGAAAALVLSAVSTISSSSAGFTAAILVWDALQNPGHLKPPAPPTASAPLDLGSWDE